MSYDRFIQQRTQNQKEVIEIFTSQDDGTITLIESPTGSGKSHMALGAAFERRKRYETAVIISTNTNANAYELRQTFKANNMLFGAAIEDCALEIGRSNFLDLDAISVSIPDIPALLPFKKLIEPFRNKAGGFCNDILIEDFVAENDLDKSATDLLRTFAQDTLTSINPKTLQHFLSQIEAGRVIITNHSYLLILFQAMRNQHNSDLFKTPIIMDEFHTLHDTAQSIYTSRFSFFRMEYAINSLLKEVVPKTLAKKLGEYLFAIRETRAALSDELSSKVSIEIINERARREASILKEAVNYRSGINAIRKQLKKLMQNTNSDSFSKSARMLDVELAELGSINLNSLKNMNVEFSPKGYPSISRVNLHPMYALKSRFWSRFKGVFLGLSGTLRTEVGNDAASYKWVMQRNGLFESDPSTLIKHLSQINLDDGEIEQAAESTVQLNRRIKEARFHHYSSLFEKSQYLYAVLSNDAFKMPYTQGDRDDYQTKREQWRKNIANFVSQTLTCNALVLTMSYGDAEVIAKELQNARDDIDVYCAQEGILMQHTKQSFMKSVDAGRTACLVGTDQYYTGLDLPGIYLQELFMAKLPFEYFKGQTGKAKLSGFDFTKDENYHNKAFIKFLQGKGRPIRGFTDKAILYIMDPRFLNSKYRRYHNFMDESAVEISLAESFSIKSTHLDGCAEQRITSSAYRFFYALWPDKSSQQILEKIGIDVSDKREIKAFNQSITYLEVQKMSCCFDETTISGFQKNESYTPWVLLLKIYVKNKADKGDRDIEARLIELMQKDGYKNTTELAKAILR